MLKGLAGILPVKILFLYFKYLIKTFNNIYALIDVFELSLINEKNN
jgi:hypothetical protein